MKTLVTGGAGFIGSALIRFMLRETDTEVVNVDKLTYAASPDALADVAGNDRYAFEQVDVCNGPEVDRVLAVHAPNAIIHLAAESHVDRSIDGPGTFIDTNIGGTYVLLDAALRYYRTLSGSARERFRFHHVSTDEVYGSLEADDAPFTESHPYDPSSPYSASKAASDHLVRAWHRTYGLPILVTNCSNNYGPFQFPEKLIPLMTINALLGEPLPVYGRGENVRDWLHVDDHASALWRVLNAGTIGQTYNLGGESEQTNLAVVQAICELADELGPPLPTPRRDLIRFVEDRPGHDLRYAIDCSRARDELGIRPTHSFETGLRKTVEWYIAHRDWWTEIRAGRYAGTRLGSTTTPGGDSAGTDA